MKTKRIKEKKFKYNNFLEDLEIINLNEKRIINASYYNIRKKCLLNEYLFLKEENTSILTESGNIFFSNIIKVLNDLKELLEKLFKKFITIMNNFKDNFNLYSKKHLSDITKYQNIDFTFDGFIFTLNKAPNIAINNLFKFSDFSIDSNVILNDLSKSNIDYLTSMSKNEDHYNNIRGILLNSFCAIPKEDFNQEIFKTFRNGEDSETEILLSNYGSVKSIYDNIKNYKNDLEKIKKEKDDAIKIYNNLIDYFKNLNNLYNQYDSKNTYKKPKNSEKYIKSFTYTQYQINKDRKDIKIPYEEETIRNIRKYSSLCSEEVRKISMLINDVFAGKMEACKAKYMQDFELMKTIIRKNKN